MKKGIVTARGYQKLMSGHPWLMAADLENPAQFGGRPAVVQLGEHWFFHSPASAIRLRRFGPLDREWLFAEAAKVIGNNSILTDAAQFAKIFSGFLREHFARLLATKRRLVIEDGDDLCLRWIFSENDLVPGLTVDIFKDIAVAEITTAPVETFWFPIKAALLDVLKPLGITLVEKRDHNIRRKEGLEVIALEEAPAPRWVKFNGLDLLAQPGSAQKTGLYLDQKFNHRVAADWAQRLGFATAYDLFCYQGGFALTLARAGLRVTGVDQSAAALAVAAQNAERNQLTPQVRWTEADAFEWLKNQATSVDMIVLDPPGMAGGKDKLDATTRALVQLHTEAMKKLNSGGVLVTCTCSQALTEEILNKVLREAGQQARRSLSVLERKGPAPDHPVRPNFPEGDYLHAWCVRVDS